MSYNRHITNGMENEMQFSDSIKTLAEGTKSKRSLVLGTHYTTAAREGAIALYMTLKHGYCPAYSQYHHA
jgi:UTP-glucose-1-phosphate uridylyltransferase